MKRWIPLFIGLLPILYLFFSVVYKKGQLGYNSMETFARIHSKHTEDYRHKLNVFDAYFLDLDYQVLNKKYEQKIRIPQDAFNYYKIGDSVPIKYQKNNPLNIELKN